MSIEWNGEGLPPVGVVCEMSGPNDGMWYKSEIVAIRDGFAIGWSVDFGGVLYSDKRRDFRPLRTKRDKWIEKVAIEIHKDGIVTAEVARKIAERLHDAGLAKDIEE